MSEQGGDLVPYQIKEVSIPFPLIQELFNEGERTFGGLYNGSASNYYDDENVVRKPKLPKRFDELVLGDDPSKYFFTYYDDTRSSYYPEGARGRRVCISTQEHKRNSNGRAREIIYSDGNNGFFLEVTEALNNGAYNEWDKSSRDGLVESNGSIRVKYRLIDEVKRELIEMNARRVDEVMYIQGDGTVPARWVRELETDNGQNTKYRERYIINRASGDPTKEKRAEIEFHLRGEIPKPEDLQIVIGVGPSSYANIVSESEDGRVRLVVYKGYEEALDIIRNDPNFAFVNDEKLDRQIILDFVRERINLLEHQWDKSQSIFEATAQLN